MKFGPVEFRLFGGLVAVRRCIGVEGLGMVGLRRYYIYIYTYIHIYIYIYR